MTRIADQLGTMAGDLAIDGAGPITFDGLADHDHGTAIFRVPLLHGFEGGDHLAVVIAVVDGENVPAVRGPLVDQLVTVVLAVYDAAHQDVVNTGVVIGEHHAQRSEEHTSELQSHVNLVCRLLLEKKKKK